MNTSLVKFARPNDPTRLTEWGTKTDFDILLDQAKIHNDISLYSSQQKAVSSDEVDPMLVDLASVSDLHAYREKIRDDLKKKLSTK